MTRTKSYFKTRDLADGIEIGGRDTKRMLVCISVDLLNGDVKEHRANTGILASYFFSLSKFLGFLC